MPSDNTIVSADPDSDYYIVHLTWEDGSKTVADLSPILDGVFEPLKDRSFFQQAFIRANGRVLTWPGEIDLGADALWFEAHPEDVPDTMKPYEIPDIRISFPEP